MRFGSLNLLWAGPPPKQEGPPLRFFLFLELPISNSCVLAFRGVPHFLHSILDHQTALRNPLHWTRARPSSFRSLWRLTFFIFLWIFGTSPPMNLIVHPKTYSPSFWTFICRRSTCTPPFPTSKDMALNLPLFLSSSFGVFFCPSYQDFLF